MVWNGLPRWCEGKWREDIGFLYLGACWYARLDVLGLEGVNWIDIRNHYASSLLGMTPSWRLQICHYSMCYSFNRTYTFSLKPCHDWKIKTCQLTILDIHTLLNFLEIFNFFLYLSHYISSTIIHLSLQILLHRLHRANENKITR